MKKHVSTNLSDFKAIIDDVLEWTHLHFPDKLRPDLGFAHNKRKQLVQMAQNQLWLVMRCRVEGRHSVTTDFTVRILQHRLEHVNQGTLENGIERFVLIGKSEAKRLDSKRSRDKRLVLEQ